ncbi:unnamed protein product [Cuscuta europaea]|uniref:Response regulatory domain-containing protein n=1 Tax=Cuscuta europaea TaxID=41803 RepID=A0A9P1EAG5_CUSEU|nr:unnamed protein product [Cuscuta europaea]
MAYIECEQFHVVAVDDSIVDRKLIERILKACSGDNVKVTVVDSGAKALRVVNEVGADLIISDYSMPGMTGYDLLREIKGCSALKHIPVVIVSSEDIPARINTCLSEGAEEYCLKPVRLSDVRPHLQNACKGRAATGLCSTSCGIF